MTYPPNPYEQQPGQQQYPQSGPQPQQPYGTQPYEMQQYGMQYPQQYPAQYQYGYGPPPQNQEQGMAVASLVCSLVGIFFCLPAILGIVFGHIGLGKAKRGEAGGMGMAQAGMIIGYVICGLWLIPVVLWLIFGFAFLGGASLVH